MTDATQKQMNYLSYLTTQAGFDSHTQANKALTGSVMYSGGRSHPSKNEASRLINALKNGVIQPNPELEIEESFEDLDEWDRYMSDIQYQDSKGYTDDILETMIDLEDLARRLPSKSDEWTSLVTKYDYVV